MGELRCGGVAVCEISNVGELQCRVVAIQGSGFVGTMHYVGVTVVTKPEFIVLGLFLVFCVICNKLIIYKNSLRLNRLP